MNPIHIKGEELEVNPHFMEVEKEYRIWWQGENWIIKKNKHGTIDFFTLREELSE